MKNAEDKFKELSTELKSREAKARIFSKINTSLPKKKAERIAVSQRKNNRQIMLIRQELAELVKSENNKIKAAKVEEALEGAR